MQAPWYLDTWSDNQDDGGVVADSVESMSMLDKRVNHNPGEESRWFHHPAQYHVSRKNLQVIFLEIFIYLFWMKVY